MCVIGVGYYDGSYIFLILSIADLIVFFLFFKIIVLVILPGVGYFRLLGFDPLDKLYSLARVMQ